MRDRSYTHSTVDSEPQPKSISLNNNNYHNDKNINNANTRKTNANNLKNNDIIGCGVRRQDSCVITNKSSEEGDLAEVHGDGSSPTASTTPTMSLTNSHAVVTVNGRSVSHGGLVKSTSVSEGSANNRKFVSKTCIVEEDDCVRVSTDILSACNKDDSGDSGYEAKDAELEIGVAASPASRHVGEPDVFSEEVTKLAVGTEQTGTSLQVVVGSDIPPLKVPMKSSSQLDLPGVTGISLEVPVESGTSMTLPARRNGALSSKKIDKQARKSVSEVEMTINGEAVRQFVSVRRTSKDTLTSRLSASKEKLFYSKEKIAASKEKLFSSKEKLFSGSKESLFSSKEKLFGGSKEKFSFTNGKSSTLKSKLTSADGSCHQTLKVQYSDVVGVANKLSKIFCRSRSQTYNLRRKEKGMSLPASFSQTTGNWVTIANLRQLDGGILDLDDRLCDVVDDRDQIIAVYTEHGPRKGDAPAGTLAALHPPRSDTIHSTAHSRSHTPDIFQVAERDYGSGLNTTDIEVTGEELNNTPPPLHVRRGSEPTLNRLSPIPLDPTGGGGPSPTSASHTVVGVAKKGVHNKRWSAAPVIDNDADTPPSSTPLKPHDPHERVFVYPGEERGEGSGEEKNPSSSASSSASSHHSATGTAFSRFARDANRCSVQVLSDNPTMTRWADAAERVGGSGMSYNEMRRRDPVGGASTSPHHSRQASLDIRHSEDSPAFSIYDKTNLSNYDNNKSNLYSHNHANGIHASVVLSPAGYKNNANGEVIYGSNRTGSSIRNSSECLYDEGRANREGIYGGPNEGSRLYPRHDRSHSQDSADVRHYNRRDQSQYSDQEAGHRRQASQTFSVSQDKSGARENLYGPSSLPYASVESRPDGSLKEERILVVLNNGCGPLGIHVIPSPAMGRGGEQGSGGLLVEGVEEGGRVAQDGRIEVHDRIVDINGHSLLNTTFHQAQEIFKDAMQAPALRLLVAKTRPRAATAPTSSATAATKPTSLSARTQAAMLASASRRPGRLISLCLTKGPHGLGFSITTRDNPARGHAPIYIKSVLPKGAAIEEGTLRIGDKLMSVNGREVTGLSQTEVANMLRKIPVGGRAVLEVSRQERGVETNPSASAAGVLGPRPGSGAEGVVPGDVKDRLKDDHPPSPQLPRPIGIEKSWEDSLMFPWKQRELITFNIPVHDSERAGLGVSVKGKTSSGSHGSNGPVDLGIFVKNVICGGAASRDGRLRENDQLININGLSLLGKPNSEAMTTLRIAMHQEGPTPGMITLTIARRMPGAQTQPLEGGEQYSNSLPRSGRDSSNSGSTGNETIGYLGGARTAPTTPTPYEGLSTDYTSGRFPPNNSTPCGDPLSSVLHNPVLHRLTGNTAALRNDSYYQATHDTWNNSELAAALPPTTPCKASREACVGGEEGTAGSASLGSPTVNLPQRDTLLIQDEYSPSAAAGSTQLVSPSSCLDDTYNSQTSLEGSGVGGGFSRDQFGRQSMSEKRHATLDAKSTDTYQRNKKVREERERQKQQQQQSGERLSGTDDLPPRPESSALPRSPSSPPPPPRRFSPHHSLPGYVRRVGMSPLAGTTSSSPSKNTFTLPRSPPKLGVAKAVQGVFAGKTSSSPGAKTFSPNSRVPSPISKKPAASLKGAGEQFLASDPNQAPTGRRTPIVSGSTTASGRKVAATNGGKSVTNIGKATTNNQKNTAAEGQASPSQSWNANARTNNAGSRNKVTDSDPKICSTSYKLGSESKMDTMIAGGGSGSAATKSYMRQASQVKSADGSTSAKHEPSLLFGKRASSGKGEKLGGEGGLLGLLRGVSRSLERPHPNTNCLGKERSTPPDIGPGLGMKKSSSLESLQTMVQEVTLAEEEACEGAGGRKGGSGRVPRGRGCNESFRAAVDRSYDAPLVGDDASPVMDTLAEEDGDGLPLQALHVTDGSKSLKLSANNKKNKGLLKGLGSMFRFGKHRKTLDSNIMIVPDSSQPEGERPPPPPPPCEGDGMLDELPDGADASTGGASCSRAERMHQLRAEHQLRHLQRNGAYPTDRDEERHPGQTEKRLAPVPAPPTEAQPNPPEQFGLPAHRPGSRGTRGATQPPAAAQSLQFAHYANYQQIQQHLRNEEQERLKQLASQQYRDFREKHYSRECREYQSQRGPREGHGSMSRPVSNYYEYESVQAIMTHAATSNRPQQPQQPPARAAHHREDLAHPTPLQFSNSPLFAAQQQSKKIAYPTNHQLNNNNNNTTSISIGSSNSSGASSTGIPHPPHHHHQQGNGSRVPMGPPYNNGSINNNIGISNPSYPIQSHRNHGPGFAADTQYTSSNSSGNSSNNNNSMTAIGSMPSNNTTFSSITYDSNAMAAQGNSGQNSLPRRAHGQHHHSSENSHLSSSNDDSIHYQVNNAKNSLKQHQPPRRHKQAPPPPPPASSLHHHPQQQQYQAAPAYRVNNSPSKGGGHPQGGGEQLYPPSQRSRQPPPPPPSSGHTLAPTHHRHPVHALSRPVNKQPPVPGSKV